MGPDPRRFGSGPNRALMLHCSLAHGGMWKPVATPLEGRLTCLAPDMPGHGRAAPWDGVGDVHDAVTRSAGASLDGPMHVVGHSFGATIALRLAMEQPDNVLSLTLIEPVLFAAARGAAEFDSYRAALKPYLSAREAKDWPAMALAFHTAWGGGLPWEALPEPARAGMIALMPMIAASEASLTDDSCGLLSENRLEGLTIPVTFLRGGDTQPVIQTIHHALMARISQASERVVEGAGHMLPLTHPAAVTTAITAHLDALENA